MFPQANKTNKQTKESKNNEITKTLQHITGLIQEVLFEYGDEFRE